MDDGRPNEMNEIVAGENGYCTTVGGERHRLVAFERLFSLLNECNIFWSTSERGLRIKAMQQFVK